MSLDIVDVGVISVIFMVVFYYAFLRYKEEKKKEREQLIPTLEFYKQKYTREKEDYTAKANSYQEKLHKIKEDLENLKKNISSFPWTDSQEKYLRSMKGSEFEYFLSTTFQMLGFKVLDPEYHREFNIDSILLLEDEDKKDYIIVDYVDFSQVGKVDVEYLRQLKRGKEKYGINKVWIITNGIFKEEIVRKIYEFDFNLLDTTYIVKFMPSINFFYEYEELKNRFHATEILHKEMFDEIIRRNHWLEEVEKKLIEAMAEGNKLN